MRLALKCGRRWAQRVLNPYYSSAVPESSTNEATMLHYVYEKPRAEQRLLGQ